jgi:hypothetical protein
MLYMDIYEYLMMWTEKDPTAENCHLYFIGRKLLILTKPYNPKQVLRATTNVNFYPNYSNGDDYFINGTHLFTNNERSQVNIEIPTLKDTDYQFRGQLCSSGYKKYVEGIDQPVAVALLIDTRLSDELLCASNEKILPS